MNKSGKVQENVLYYEYTGKTLGKIKAGVVLWWRAASSSLSCFDICMQMPDQNGISNAYGWVFELSEKPEMEGGKKQPYTIVNDLSGDRKCSATQYNNQSALKITSKYSLLASGSLGAIPSSLWVLVRNVPMNLGWIILGQSCQNIGKAQWKEHSYRLTFLDSDICI